MSAKQRPKSEEVLFADEKSQEQPQDPLSPYRTALTELKSAGQQLADMREVRDHVVSEAARLELERERLLEADGDDDELGRLTVKNEKLRRKLKHLEAQIAEAEAELKTSQAMTFSRFVTLHRTYVAHVFETEKAKLTSQMALSPGQLAIDQVTMCLRPVVEAKRLELVATDPAGVIAGAQRLLESVSNAEGFAMPVWQVQAPSVAPGVSVAPPKARLIGPFVDRGMSARQIEAELERIHIADPSLDMAARDAKLAELHPELFLSEEQALGLNQSLSPEATPWRGSMVGTTTLEPVEETFSHAT